MPPEDWLTDRIVMLTAALLIGALLGGARARHAVAWLYAPSALLGRALRRVERKLNREKRDAGERRKRGMILTLCLMLAAALGGFGVMALLAFVPAWGGVFEIVLLVLLLEPRRSLDFALAVAERLLAGDSESARAEFRGTAWRNAALFDGHGMCRAAVETLAVHGADRIAALGFWYALLGLPGAFACRMLTALSDTALAAREDFGRAADALSGAAHYVPSLIAAGLLLASGLFLPFCRPGQAARAFVLHLADGEYRRRQAAVMGALLNLKLGGALSVYAPGPYLGGAAEALPRDVRRAGLLYGFSGVLGLLVLLLFIA